MPVKKEKKIFQKFKSRTFLFGLTVFIIYTLITLLLFHHRLPHLTTHYAMPDIDTEGGFWYEWYLSYIHKNQLIYDVTNFTAFPIGYDIAYAPIYNLIYTIHLFILEHIIGFTWSNFLLVTNISSLFVYPLSALGAALLAYFLTKNKIGSFLAGIAFSFTYNTVLWGRGQMSVNHTEIIPFYFISLFYFLKKKNVFSLILSVLIFSIMFQGDAYFAFFSALFSVIIILLYEHKSFISMVKTLIVYELSLVVVNIFINFGFFLSNLYIIFDKQKLIQSGRNSVPRNELLDTLYYFSSPIGSFLHTYLGNLSTVIVVIPLVFVIFGCFYLIKRRMFLLLFVCFLFGVILSSYIPPFFEVNLLYFRFFSMFRGVSRATVHTSLFLGLLIAYTFNFFFPEGPMKKDKKILLYFSSLVLAVIIFLSSLTMESTWFKSTNFNNIISLYTPIKNNATITSIAAYPMSLGAGTNGFPQTYQLMGQLIDEKPLASGVNPFSEANREYYNKISDIQNPKAVDTLSNYGINTIIIYNNFIPDHEQVNNDLKNDTRLQFIGHYTAPYDEGYIANIDKSKDINVYLIKGVGTKPKPLFSTFEGLPLQYKKISANKYIVYVNNNKTLQFNLPYTEKWGAFSGDLSSTNDILINSKKDNFIKSHMLVGKFANGWIVDKSNKNGIVTVFFLPQTNNLLVTYISLTTFIAIVLFLILNRLFAITNWRQKQ